MEQTQQQRRVEVNLIVWAILIGFAVLGLALAFLFISTKLSRAAAAPAMSRATMSSIKNIEGAVKLYEANRGEFAAGTDSVLADLTVSSTFNGRLEQPYLEQPPLDAWNRSMHYQYPPPKTSGLSKPAIWSDGPNRRNDNGGGDDIRNW